MPKQDIHPNYALTTFTCGCGAVHQVSSTMGERAVHIELCSKCHPFYTGVKREVDTAGRMDRFRAREAAAVSKKK